MSEAVGPVPGYRAGELGRPEVLVAQCRVQCLDRHYPAIQTCHMVRDALEHLAEVGTSEQGGQYADG
jgi:hypothetical protein